MVRAVKNNRARTENKYGVKALCSLSPTDFTGTAKNAMVLEPADKRKDEIGGQPPWRILRQAVC